MTTAAIRVPLVAGVDAGVGTSTLAAALHARDGGVLTSEADVVVCAATEESLRAAAAVACPGSGPRPVLAVTGGPLAGPLPAAVRTRYCSVVELPRVEDWAADAPGADAAADVLGVPAEQLSAPLRSYAEALQVLVSALLGAGVLAAGTPPMAIRPRPADPWRGTHRPAARPVRPVAPVAPVTPTRPVAPIATAEPPDDRTTPARHRLPDSPDASDKLDEARSRPTRPDETRSRPPRAARSAGSDETRSRPTQPDESRSRTARSDENRSRPEGTRGGAPERADATGGRAPRRAGAARSTRPPRRTPDVRPAPSRPHRAVRDEDDESIEARNLAADRAPAVRGRAG